MERLGMAAFDRDWLIVMDQQPDLHKAAAADDLDTLKKLLEEGEFLQHVDTRDQFGRTPLGSAAKSGAVRCVEYLLQKGAEFDSLDVKAQTPLFSAVYNDHFKTAQMLLKAGANPNGNQSNLATPLYLAAMHGHLQILSMLIDFGAALDLPSPFSLTSNPLYTTVTHQHWQCFAALLYAGANPNLTFQNKRVPLYHTLVKYGASLETMQLLWECGGCIWVKDRDLYPDELGEASTEHSELLSSLRNFPRTLKSSCRLLIRKIFGPHSLCHISNLPLPSHLQMYLSFGVKL